MSSPLHPGRLQYVNLDGCSGCWLALLPLWLPFLVLPTPWEYLDPKPPSNPKSSHLVMGSASQKLPASTMFGAKILPLHLKHDYFYHFWFLSQDSECHFKFSAWTCHTLFGHLSLDRYLGCFYYCYHYHLIIWVVTLIVLFMLLYRVEF